MKTTNLNILKLLLSSITITMLGLFFPPVYLFFPSLFLYYGIKDSIIKAILALLVPSFIMGYINPTLGLAIFVVFAPMILSLHYLITNKYGVDVSLGLASLVTFISILSIMYTYGINGSTLSSEESVRAYIEGAKLVLSKSGSLNTSNLEGNLRTMYLQTIALLPSIIVIISIAISYMTYLLTGRRLLKDGIIVMQPPSFEFLRLPKIFVAISILVLLILKLLGFQEIFMNLALIFTFMTFVNGLATLKFLLFKMGASQFIQVLALVFFIFLPGMQIASAVLGLVDSLFNLRRLQN